MKKILKKTSIVILPLMLMSCSIGTNNSSGCSDDDMFCEEEEEEEEVVLTLEDENGTNYSYDTSVTNENGSVNYEIFVRSFYDSNNDGIGDLNGVTAKLDYLQTLGVKNLWLMPIFASPTYHGYDTTDYYSIESDYGSMSDFQNLINKAKEKNIGIILDMVWNHTSNKHSWFTQSYSDYTSNNTASDSKADWYNWGAGSSTYNGLQYEAEFGGDMPDLNLSCEAVKTELKKVCKTYIDMGVAGFRLDAVKYYFGTTPNSEDTAFLNEMYTYCKSLNEDFYMVGECYDTSSQSNINTMYKSGIDSLFSFTSCEEASGKGSILKTVKSSNTADDFGDYIETQEKAMKAINPNAVSSYFLSNHDMDRVSKSLYGFTAKAGATLTYLLPGTPYIYYGEEIGLKGTRTTSPDDQSDVKRRLPIIWSKSDSTGLCGWPESNRQDLNTNISQVTDGVYDQLSTNYSLLNHYRKVLNVRNKYSFIKDSVFTNLTDDYNIDSQNKYVLAYRLTSGDQSIVVIHNFNAKITKVNIGDLSTEILDSISVTHKIPTLSTTGDLTLGGYSTVILK